MPMRVADLGEMDGPMLLFGGPYSNLAALEALIAQARVRGLPPERTICTGDVVAYCAEPAECVARIRALGCHVIAGNCERQLAAGESDCGCGFDEGSACDLLSAGWYGFADARIGSADRDWMRGLPDLAVFRHAGRRHGVVHGGVTDIARFLWPVSPDDAFAQEFAAFAEIAGPVDAIIAGHCGIPFVRETPWGRWINAGVIGMPPNDGRPATRFALLDSGRAEIEELDHDHRAARAAMERAGLTQGYHAALCSGYWPSEDVLPAVLRASG
ncbi:metallophosphoesterase family protein [Jhaorihella thermophila]